MQKQCQKQQQIQLNFFNLFQSLESISKELVAKLQTRLAFWDVNTTLIGDVLVEMVCDDLSRITREDFPVNRVCIKSDNKLEISFVKKL